MSSLIEEDTYKIKVKVAPEEVVFVDMIIKSYEGLAMLTANRDEKGLIYLDVTDGTYEDIMDILNNLNNKFPVEILEK